MTDQPSHSRHWVVTSHVVIRTLEPVDVQAAILMAADMGGIRDGLDWTTFESRIVLEVDTREGSAPGLTSPTGLVAMARVRSNGETA